MLADTWHKSGGLDMKVGGSLCYGRVAKFHHICQLRFIWWLMLTRCRCQLALAFTFNWSWNWSIVSSSRGCQNKYFHFNLGDSTISVMLWNWNGRWETWTMCIIKTAAQLFGLVNIHDCLYKYIHITPCGIKIKIHKLYSEVYNDDTDCRWLITHTVSLSWTPGQVNCHGTGLMLSLWFSSSSPQTWYLSQPVQPAVA